jgi:hypothetical protein
MLHDKFLFIRSSFTLVFTFIIGTTNLIIKTSFCIIQIPVLIEFTIDKLITFTVAARQLLYYKYSGPFQQHTMLQHTCSEEKRLKKGPGVIALCYTVILCDNERTMEFEGEFIDI